MLEENAAETDAARKRARDKQSAAYAEAIARDHYEGYAHVSLWNKVRIATQRSGISTDPPQGRGRTTAFVGQTGCRPYFRA